jgi:hypothetical protein
MKYDQIASAYIEITESRTYTDIDVNKLPSAVLENLHQKTVNEETEHDFHNWVSKTEPDGYLPFQASKLIKNTSRDSAVSNWRGNQVYNHNTDLVAQHKKNLTGEDMHNINHLTTGGLSYGGETGSALINDHCHKQFKKDGVKPSHFTIPKNDEENDDYTSGSKINLDSIDNSLKKNKLEKSMKTYSGIPFNPSDRVGKQGLLHLPAFTSSTRNRGTAAIYASAAKRATGSDVSHILEIHHPKGATGAYIGNDEDYTPFSDDEFIHPRGTTLKIHPEPTKYDLEDGKECHVWKARRLIGMEKNK